MAIEIRRANPDDLAVVVDLVAEYCEADGHPFDRATVIAGVEPLLVHDDLGQIWLAVDRSSAVGYAAVTWGWSIEVGGLDVVLDEVYTRRRGEGIGSALIEALETACRSRGVRRIFLETERPNDAARRLYERLGYRADTSIWMSKDLA